MKEVKINVPTPDDVIPEEFRVHMLNAAKEFLLAFKCLVDDRLRKLEEMEKEFANQMGKKEVKKIDID